MADSIDFGFSSEISNLNYIDDVFESIAAIYDITDTVLYDLILITREAAVNSIKHAYKDKKGIIDILIEIENFSNPASDSFIEITIKDSGNGFDPDKVPDPLDQKNLLKSSGRGVLLIKKLSDEYTIISSPDNGTKITFRKYLK